MDWRRREYINCHWSRVLKNVWLYWHTRTWPNTIHLIESKKKSQNYTTGLQIILFLDVFVVYWFEEEKGKGQEESSIRGERELCVSENGLEKIRKKFDAWWMRCPQLMDQILKELKRKHNEWSRCNFLSL